MRSFITHITRFFAAAALFVLAGPTAYAQTAPGTRIANVASVRAGFGNGDSLVLSSDTAAVTVQPVVLPTPSFSVTKSASQDSVLPGGVFTYAIVVRNTGLVTLTGVQVRDTIDTAMLQVVGTTRGIVDGSVVSWDLDSLGSGAVDSVVIAVRVRPTAPEGTLVGNTVYVRTVPTGPAPQTASADIVVATTAPPSGTDPRLSIEKSASADTVMNGDVVSFVIRVRNTGDVPLTSVVVTDSLPSVLSFVSASPRAVVNGSLISMAIDTLAIGASDSLTITARLAVMTVGRTDVENRAYATSTQTPLISDSAMIAAVRPFVPLPSGAVTKVGPSTASRRDTVLYTIGVANTGNVALTDATVLDSLDRSMLFVGSTPAPTSFDASAGVLQWALGTVDTQETRTISVLVRYADTLTADRTVTNIAGFKGNEIGWVRATASTDVTIPAVITPQPRLALTKRVSAASVPTGGLATYTLVVANTGNATMTNVSVVDTLPAAVQPVLVGAPAVLKGRIVTARFDSLVAGQSDSLGIVVRLMSTVTDGEQVQNTAVAVSDQNTSVASAASFAAVRTANSSCKIEVTVTPSLVIGNGIAASVIRALVTDTLGTPKADGTPVVFRTSVGFFSNGLDSITVATINGIAVDSLRAVISSSSVVTAQASVSINEALCFATRSVDIVFFPGAIAGLVTNAWTGSPELNATIRVYSSSGALIAEVRPAADGSYLVPVPRTDDYQVQITTTDVFGQTTTIRSDITVVVPGIGGRPPVLNTIVVSGRAYYYVSMKPIAAAGVPVFLTVLPPVSGTAVSDRIFAGRAVVDTTVTDSTGYYQFQALPAGVRYEVMVADPSLSGSVSIDPLNPGEFMKDANIPIVLNPGIQLTKTGPARAFTNDTVSYVISLRNAGNLSATNVVVRDSLDRGMRFVSSVPAPTSVDTVAGVVRWTVGKLDSASGANAVYSVTVRVRFADTLRSDYRATNSAAMTSDQTTDTLVFASTDVIQSVLTVQKTARRKIVEIGDQATYALSVRNASSSLTVRNVVVEDRAPMGFTYLAGSTFRDTLRLPDPVILRTPAGQVLRWSVADSLGAGSTIGLSYRMIVGAGAAEGDGVNRAQAFATESNGTLVSSAVAEERVEVQTGVFTDRGVIIGKVFYDPNNNAYQDPGESGVKGVELMMEDGTRIITGDDGKYSVPEVAPGRHVIKVRAHTLPAQATLHAGYNDFAFDPSSRFVDVTPGGITRADFYLDPVAYDSVTIAHRVTRYGVVNVQRFVSPKNVTFIDDERPALMKLTGLNFEVGKAILRPEAYPIIRQLADILRENPEERVVIMGHTDSSPIRTAEFPNNRVLSIARAEAVKIMLTNVEGIDLSRIETRGYGESRPVSTNATREGKALNRRVEFSFGPVKDSSAVRQDAAVLVRIPVEYRGDAPVRAIEITDSLPSAMTYADSSGVFNGRKLQPRREGQRLVWTIDSVGSSISGNLFYQVRIPRPDSGIVDHRSSTVGIRLLAAETLAVAAELPTVNRAAVAVRGRAVNFIMPSVLFETAKATLHPGAVTSLEATGALLKNDPTLTVVVEGHTDSRPIRTKQFPSNMELSQARAQTIVDVLAETFGIARERMEPVGFGEHRPIETNRTAEGRQANRRIEIRIVRSEFVTAVLPEGGVDSSQISRSSVAPASDTPSLPDSTQLSSNDRVVIGIATAWKGSGRRASNVAVVDSLAPWLEIVDGSLTTSGVDSLVSTKPLRAVLRPGDDRAQVRYDARLLGPTTVLDLLRRSVTIMHDGTPGRSALPQRKDGRTEASHQKP